MFPPYLTRFQLDKRNYQFNQLYKLGTAKLFSVENVPLNLYNIS